MANEHMRMISDREEIPTWARTLRESIEELARRTSQAERAMPGGQRYRARGESVSATANMPSRRQLGIDRDLENGIDRLTTSGQRRADAIARQQNAELHEMRAMLSRLRRQLTPAERTEAAAAYHRADSIYAALGRATPEPLPGESPMAFRHRLADGLKDVSKELRGAHLDALPASAFSVVESRVYADALAAAKTGAGAEPGTLNKCERRAETGHNITEYYGDNRAWMSPFMTGGAKVRINRKPGTAKAL